MPSREHLTSLVARGRAELWLRMARARGLELSWTGKPLFFEGFPILRTTGPIDFGDHCRFRGGPTRTRVITRAGGRIVFGKGVGVNYGAELTSEHLIRVGDGSGIGPLVTIFDTNFHPLGEGDEVKEGPVEIGANVWIGRHAMILPGVTIGDHSVIAGGAVVVRDLPPPTLVSGNPAKPVREIKAAEGWQRI